jgi:hypothetical protein
MTQAEKESKVSLLNLCMKEDLRSGGPSVSGLATICERLVDGEKFDGAVDMVVGHGTPQMMAELHGAGLITAAHWEAWKARLTPADAELVLQWPDEWPHEVREWATVVAIQSL